LQRELAADGFVASLGTIKRVRRELGLCCVQRKRRFRVATTDSRHSLAVAPNLLAQDFRATRPDEVWTADITYVPTEEGWLYVAAIKDLFAGEIVGRSFGAPLTSRAFVENLKAYAKEAGLTYIHLHQTRHTYARILAEETGSFLEAQEALNHENQATTRAYVQRITVKRDRHGSKVSARIRKGQT
jgi:integrase